MDINTLRGISVLLAFGAFIGICLWAYSGRQKSRFDEAAHLPFADEPAPLPGDTTALTRGDHTP